MLQMYDSMGLRTSIPVWSYGDWFHGGLIANGISKHTCHPTGDSSLTSCYVSNSIAMCSQTEVFADQHKNKMEPLTLGYRVPWLVPGN